MKLAQKIICSIQLVLLFSFSGYLKAGEGILPQREVSKLFFEENKNQWPSQVKYQADIPGGSLFFEKNTLTFLQAENVDFHGFHDPANASGPVAVHYHAYKVNFENSNPGVEISGTELSPFIKNYYRGNDPSKWAEGVNVYEGVKYGNIYSGIDIKFYTSGQHLKYDFIIRPGGDFRNISMDYQGADSLSVEYGHLYIKTSLGISVEQKPFAYQEISGNRAEVACSYVLSGNKLRFAVGNYDPSLSLIIDPTLIAATYSGSTADNWGYTATYDAAGNIYSAGIAASNGYPATVGAFQTTFQGGGLGGYNYPFDIAIIKYNPTGTSRLFATYYGGSDNEQPHSLIVNSANQLYVAGRTYSSNFPTLGAYDNSYNGGADIIIGKFNSTGGLLASTFIGGASDDGVNYNSNFSTFGITKFNYADDGRSEILLDGSGNVYLAASTQSANFPTVNAYDAALNGTQDGCVFKMNANLSALAFSTYLGGSSYDAAYGLKLDNSNNVYVTGGTASSDFPTTAGVIHPAYMGGTTDGFVSVLSSGGNSLMASTFLGTAAYDQSYLIENDASNNIYLFGQTRGAYPVTAGTYSNAGSAQFIHKITGNLTSTIFSTVIGTGSLNPNISPTAFLVDSCESIYIAGWGRCAIFGHPNSNTVNGMPITANAIQPTTDGCDFYFMMLKPDAKGLTYATYYGENGGSEPDHVDGGTSRFDSRACIYQSVCGSCGGTNGFPTTPGAWSSTNNSSNCNNAVVKIDMKIKPVAVANITGPNTGCAPFTVVTHNTGSIGSDYIWDFGDGSPLSTLVSPSHTYTAAGTYTMTLFAIDSMGICGYIDTAILVIHVGLPPVLSTTQTNILCFGANNGSANVTAVGGMPPLTYVWSPSSQTTTSATGLSATTYTVTVTDAIGCPSTKTVTITQPPNLTLTAVPVATKCALINGSATATAGGGSPGYTYAWTGGQTTSTATGLAAGSYSVVLTDSKGCTKTTSVTVAASVSVAATFSSTNSLCGLANGSATVTPTGGAPAFTYLWSNGQTTAAATGLAAGTYSCTVTDMYGCTFSSGVTVNMTGGPTALAGNDVTLCAGGSTQLNASGGVNYQWVPATNLSSSTVSNPVATPSSTITYTVIATDVNGCTDTDDLIITVNPQPVANFSSTSVCLGNPTQFTDLTTGGGTSWSWNFGDGGISTQQHPSHTYTASGTYSVTLVSTAPGGCNSTITALVTVYPQPTANFSATSVCIGNPTAFTDLSTGGATSWSWNFGDGNTSAQQNPSNTYSASGSYTATLTVTGAGGCASTFSLAVTVFTTSTAVFSAPPVCLNTPPMQFTDQSTGASTWTWNFGDGSANSNLQNPAHTYSASGTYSVTLIVASGSGCADTTVQTVTVNPAPAASFSASSVCFNNPTFFSDNSSGNPTLWNWDFGDGNSDTAQSPTHTYNAPGTYTVVLIASNAFGCQDTFTQNVTVNPLPVASYSATSVCIGSTTCFSDLTTISSGSVTGWSWNFGDPNSGANNISNSQNPCHTYTSTGTFNVFLTSTSNNGCQGTVSQNVTVNPPPVAGFTVNTVCLNSPTSFANTSSSSTQWSWNFGDGNTSIQQNPIHTYLGYGNYIVTLIVSSGGSCTDTITDTVTVSPLPVVKFVADTVCVGNPTAFWDLSFISAGAIISWNWDFGDGATSAQQYPVHTYTSAGTYNVTLTVSSNTGCTSSVTMNAVVHALPNADFSIAPSSLIGLTDPAEFTDLSTGGAVSWSWWFGDGDSSQVQNPIHLYGDTGSYLITLAIVNSFGCVDTVQYPVEIQDYTFYIPNAFTPNGDDKNDFFFGAGIGIVEYELMIFDRWGNLIFYCKVNDLPQSPPCRWNGKVDAGSSNERVQEDVYVWKVNLVNIYKKNYSFVGNVTVIR